MSKLNGNDLAHIANHYEAIYREWNTQIYFCFDSVKNGEKAFEILTRVYADEMGPNKYSSYGLDKRDFYLGFNSRNVATDVCNEINAAIAAYREVEHQDIHYEPDPVSYPESNGSVISGPSNSNTYMIIGAVAAIIILVLLWKPKR